MSLAACASADVNPDGSVGLTGTIPMSLVNLTNLKALDLGPNALTGSIPYGLCHDNIELLSLPSNKLTANLSQILNCRSAARIDLSYNQITGTLPNTTHWELYSLSGLVLNDNQINGTLPRAIFKLPSLAYLGLESNRYGSCMMCCRNCMSFEQTQQSNSCQVCQHAMSTCKQAALTCF